MYFRGLVQFAVVVFLIGCGATNPNVADNEDAISTTNSEKSDSSTQTTAAVPDETAAKAKTFCEFEIKKSKQKPSEVLDKKQISACLIALRPQIQKDCAKGVAREVIFKIIIGKDGSVVGAFAIGDAADSAEAACIGEKVKPALFPQFTGKDQQVVEKYPFQIVP